MALYPEAQKKAQTEIDRVIGRNRLPNFEDQDSLVYVEALVREVMRWHPALPTGKFLADTTSSTNPPRNSHTACNLRG